VPSLQHTGWVPWVALFFIITATLTGALLG